MDNIPSPKTLTDLAGQSPSLRDTFAWDVDASAIQVDALHISNSEPTAPDAQLDFSDTQTPVHKENSQLHYRRWFIRLVTTTWIAGILALIAFGVYQYHYQLGVTDTASTPLQSYMHMVHRGYKTVLGYLGSADSYRQLSNLSLVWTDAQSQLDNVHNSALGFVDKKYITQQALYTMLGQYTQQQTALENIQRDLAQYGFLPQELVSIFQDSDIQVSLQRWLVALESIKFSTAIQVFSHLDTFITEFATYMGVWTDYVREQMQFIASRGDTDIYAFLSNCYMNPYELSYDCSVIGDFDVRYATQTESRVDQAFLKQLLYYIDQKLEQTQIPSFNIIFQRFDPRAETITFSIEVNTFQQDEAALVQAGIVNPHIYIVTNVIHLLKQNRFIQWSAIDTKQINIQPKIVRIGSNQFVVNNSTLQYTLPLQKDVAREIYDFQAQ